MSLPSSSVSFCSQALAAASVVAAIIVKDAVTAAGHVPYRPERVQESNHEDGAIRRGQPWGGPAAAFSPPRPRSFFFFIFDVLLISQGLRW